jgi:hypothetical protein
VLSDLLLSPGKFLFDRFDDLMLPLFEVVQRQFENERAFEFIYCDVRDL